MHDRYEDLPPVLDVPAVAEVLDCGQRMVRNLIARGEIGSVRLGRLVKVPRHALVVFLSSDGDAAEANTLRVNQ